MTNAFGFASLACILLLGCSESSPDSGAGGAAGSAGAPATGGAAGTPGASGAAGSSTGGSGGATGGAATAGTGGSAGSSAGSGGAGVAGSAGTAGAAGSGSGVGCTGMPLCDDFEANAAGMTPAGWTLVNATGCSGMTFSATVDTTQFHSGSKSVKVTGGDSCGPLLVNTAAFAKLTDGEVYGRFYLRMPTTQSFHHTVLASLGLKANADAGGSFDQAGHLQFAAEDIGGANKLVWQSDDSNILPAKAPNAAETTTFPKSDTWTCVEFHISASKQAIETWIDGAAVPGMTFIPGTTTPNQEVNGQWKPASLVAPTSFGLTLVEFGDTPLSIYFDDAALGATRIGCK